MKIIEFLKTADTNQLCNFISILISGCECCGDCPLAVLSEMNFDDLYYGCTNDQIKRFLNSEMKEGETE